MAAHITTLSIFIILLAFFIALNSMAHFVPEKATPVLESVRQTFGTAHQKKMDEDPVLRPDEEKAAGMGDLLQELEDLFRSRIEGVKAVKIQGRNILLLRMPLDELESGLDQGGVTDEETGKQAPPFLESLRSMVTAGENGRAFHVRIVLNTERREDVTAATGDGQQLAKQASRIARKVEEAGIPKPLLGIGVEQGPAGTADLIFEPYRPFIAAEFVEKLSSTPPDTQADDADEADEESNLSVPDTKEQP